MSDPITITFLDRETLPKATQLRAPRFRHHWENFPSTAPEHLPSRAAGAQIIVTNKVPLRRDVLVQLPELRMIAVAATGTDVIDTDYCADHGITVSNVKDYATASVPEHTFALLLSLSRSVQAYHRSVAKGRWAETGQFCYFDHPISDLRGKALGIIGRGALGQSVAKLGAAFGMRVHFLASPRHAPGASNSLPAAAFWAQSDVISIHCPLNDQTRGMINVDAFAAMTRRPFLINTARGGIVDEAALARALQSGQIAGAAFDVLSAEPMPPDHPFHALMDRPDFLLTPHVAWASAQATQRLADQLISNIEAFVAQNLSPAATTPPSFLESSGV